jgi:hypothetical protein
MSDLDSMIDRRILSALLKWAVILTMVYTWIFYRKWKRRRRTCPHCRSEFKGDTAGKCPACGQRI